MLSRFSRFNVTCECNEEEINDDDGVGWMLCPGFEFFACGSCECCWAQHVLYQQRERIRVVNCIARQVLIQFPFHMNLSTLVGRATRLSYSWRPSITSSKENFSLATDWNPLFPGRPESMYEKGIKSKSLWQ